MHTASFHCFPWYCSAPIPPPPPLPLTRCPAVSENEGFFFIETSALDSTNVEDAFTQILTEIYWMMNKKALAPDEDGVHPSRGQTININAPQDDNAAAASCCYT